MPSASCVIPGRALQVEEAVEIRIAEVEIDENDPPARTRQRDGEVGNRGRLPLSLERARDHDRAGVPLHVREVEVDGEDAERLRFTRLRPFEHDQAVVLAHPARRLRQSREQRQPELLLHLLDRADARVQRVPEEREPDPEQQAEHEAEQARCASCAAGSATRRSAVRTTEALDVWSACIVASCWSFSSRLS